MASDRQNKIYYWIFKIVGIVISCIFPVWAICSKFPLWTETHGTGRSVGTGIILMMIVFVIICRKTVFSFLGEKLKLKHAPPVIVWFILLIVSYVLLLLAHFLQDLIIVLWMGLLGCALGTVVTYIGEQFFIQKEE